MRDEKRNIEQTHSRDSTRLPEFEYFRVKFLIRKYSDAAAAKNENKISIYSNCRPRNTIPVYFTL
jgi:hypothetical protein